MADEKLSALTEVTSSADADLLYTVQNGNSRKTTRAKVIAPTVRHDIDQALLAAAKEKARQNISAAALDSTGIVPRNQLPASLFAGTGTVDSEAEMLALDVPVGFTAVRTDIDKNFVLNALPASDLANWVELASPTAPVLSVSGKQGAVELEVGDIIGLDEDLADIQAAMLVKSAQTLTVVEKGQIRANIGIDTITGLRNRVLNGEFFVNQRGVSTQNGAGYCFDNWYFGPGAGVTSSISRRVLEANEVELLQGSSWCAVWTRSIAGTSESILKTFIENVRTFSNRLVTLTFWAKASVATTIVPKMDQFFGTTGTPSPTVYVAFPAVALTSQWVKYSITAVIPSIEGKRVESNNYLGLYFGWLNSAPNATVEISRISLVEGDATKEFDPFDYRPLALETLLCMRYFETQADSAYFNCSSGIFPAGSLTINMPVSFKVEKRVTPSVSVVYGWRGGNDQKLRNDNFELITTKSMMGYVFQGTSTTGYIDLNLTWQANAGY